MPSLRAHARRGVTRGPTGQVVVVVDVGPDAASPAARRAASAPWTSACSITSTPPGAQQRAGAGGDRQRDRRPSALPPYSATSGSWSRTSGSSGTAPSGMYGGLLTTTSTSPSSSAKAVVASPSTQLDVQPEVVAVARPPRRARGRTARPRAPTPPAPPASGERDRAGPGAQVDDDRGAALGVGQVAQQRRRRGRPPSRSPAAARRHPGRPTARGGGTAPGR